MISRAIRERWPVPDGMKRRTLHRLAKVIRKTAVMVNTKDGPVPVDGPADANAVRAAAVLVAMTGQNQTDDWNNDKNDRLDAGKATERVDGVVLKVAGVDAKD